jgi:hypothetical protein
VFHGGIGWKQCTTYTCHGLAVYLFTSLNYAAHTTGQLLLRCGGVHSMTLVLLEVQLPSLTAYLLGGLVMVRPACVKDAT